MPWPTAESLEVLGRSDAVDTITGFAPSEEPNEARADRGPEGRMVSTNTWRTKTPTDRDAMGPHFKPNRQTEPLVTTPPLLERSHEHPVSTRDRPARTGADVRIEESATNGEVCLVLRPSGRASKLRFRSERGRCFEDDSVEQRAARQLPGRPPQHRARAAKRNAQLGARMPRRTVCRQLSAARKSTSTRKPPASTLLALTAAPIASHRSRTSARPMPVPFTTSLLALAR